MRLIKWGLSALAVAAAAGAIVVGVAAFAGTAQAQEGPGRGFRGPGIDATRYQQALAEKLGITVEQLTNVQTAAKNEAIDAAIAAGRLTPEQGNRMKTRPGPIIFGLSGRGVDSSSYEALLAAKLNKTVEELRNIQTAARNQVIDEAIAAGRLTPEQGNRLKNGQPANPPRQRFTPPSGAPGARPQGAAPRGAGPRDNARALMRGIGDVFTATAEKVGLTRVQLLQELNGRSLAQVAQAHNVSRDELKSTILGKSKAELDAAVGAGRLTRQQADAVYSGLTQRIDQMIDQVHQARTPGQRPANFPGRPQNVPGPRGNR